ncbi:N-acetylmuramoyl-L-alanine amidase [Mucilaginibacter sp. BT774]|uniref:N-acetylmuramoyl-L-alanine amidase n=1 Tax=Mucilaginibacter sp. BT774 TaxID=3062276 RepID=UPI00267509F1|nr:N-acetylmuramoyl-L-alanine amidase [Mucilaginibacter sp. BT774]MDO3627145.1 N-acetylmuramoyl-L-alanine amidase [Mucilaginibacter sp. BT774]
MIPLKKYCYCLLLLPTVIAASCSPKGPYAVTNQFYKHHADSAAKVVQLEQPAVLVDSTGAQVPSEFVGTVNFNLRKPNYVIIHFTAQDSLAQTLHTFTVTQTQVSAHYVVGKDGKVVHMLNDYLRAWHAGVSRWGSISDMNSCSIGIEIDNNGNEPFSGPQIKSLLALLGYLKKTYNIPATNFIGHQDIAPLRKPDPGPYFPWKILAQHGFGYWSDDVLELAPDNFDYTTALKLIGYDTRDINAAVVAFKRHFVQTDIKPQLTQLDLNVLYNVYVKY